MDEIVRSTLKAYIDAFDSFPCDNPQINAEIDKFKEELTSFARSARDITDFMSGYEAGGYGKRYVDLFGKIALAQTNDLTVEEIEERQQITPVEFVAQYNTAYDAIRVHKHRVKAIRAYENLFELAGRSEDMLDFNIESERRNLLFKLSADDAVEQSEFLMEASDPLDKIAYPGHERRARDWEQAMSDADITFSSDFEQEQVARNASRETQRMAVITAIATVATEYVGLIIDLLSAANDRAVRTALSGMIHKRREMRFLIDEILPAFGLDLDTVFEDKYYRRLLLAPTNLDATGRIKRCNHPQNIEAIKEIIKEEILADKSVTELVFRPANDPPSFSIVRHDKELARKYERKAEELNVKLSYYMTK